VEAVTDFVLIQSIFLDRWVARRIVNETPQTFVLENTRTLDMHRVSKKSSMLRGYVDAESAVSAASRLTQKLQGARKHYEQRVVGLLQEFSNE